MANHPGIAKISLTGSVPTGKRVMAAAAGTLKHVTMELGGKSALIVFDDADVDDSVSAAILGNFFTQARICSNGTRVSSCRAASATHSCAVSWSAPAPSASATRSIRRTQMGPLISTDHLEKVLAYVGHGEREGASLLTGGRRITERPARPRQFHPADDLRRLQR
jgi:betaine-aldehyde dehydrogenase